MVNEEPYSGHFQKYVVLPLPVSAFRVGDISSSLHGKNGFSNCHHSLVSLLIVFCSLCTSSCLEAYILTCIDKLGDFFLFYFIFLQQKKK